MHALNRASSIFVDGKQKEKVLPLKPINFRNIPTDEQVPKILDEFMDVFEKECLEKGNGSNP